MYKFRVSVVPSWKRDIRNQQIVWGKSLWWLIAIFVKCHIYVYTFKGAENNVLPSTEPCLLDKQIAIVEICSDKHWQKMWLHPHEPFIQLANVIFIYPWIKNPIIVGQIDFFLCHSDHARGYISTSYHQHLWIWNFGRPFFAGKMDQISNIGEWVGWLGLPPSCWLPRVHFLC